MAAPQKGPGNLNYEEEKNKLKRFLAEFHTKNSRGHKEFVYARQLTNIAHREQVNINIDLDHVADFDPELSEAIRNNVRRFVLLASEAIWELLPDYREHEPPARDALDVYINHRQLMEARTRNPGENRPAHNAFPPELMRRYEVNFKLNSDIKSLPVRDVKAEHIGKLVNIRGIVTRATEVKPMLQVPGLSHHRPSPNCCPYVLCMVELSALRLIWPCRWRC